MANPRALGEAIIRLIPETPAQARLPKAEGRPPIAAAMGIGEPDALAGIASPLTEVGRTLGQIKTLTSPDGLFTLEYQDPTQIAMSDAAGQAVVFNYADD